MDSTSAISGSPQIIDALKNASARTGAGFDYLYRTALRESGLKPMAKAPTSSASGLFQFIEQTWFETVKQVGPRHGLAAFSDNITRGSEGRYFVADPAARQEILALRNDPAAAAIMAGELAVTNRAELADALGRAPTDGELYIGHFLGPGGAARLIRAAAVDADASAAELFPAAANANRSIFYDRSGHERSAAEVYRLLVHKHASSAAPAPARPKPDEGVSPFAGIIAFFEELFSGGRQAPREETGAAGAPDARRRRAPVPAPSVPTGYSVVAYWPAQPGEFPPGDARRGLAAREASEASEAYRGQDQMSRFAGAEPDTPPDRAEPWGGGLFTNSARTPGPLVAMGAREPM